MSLYSRNPLNMQPAAWIALLIFVTMVIFSIVMAAISEKFRSEWYLTNVYNYLFLFTFIIVVGVLMVFSTQCASIGGKYDDKGGKYCQIYAWVLVVLSLALLGLYMTKSIMDRIDEEKDKKSGDKTTTVSTVPAVQLFTQ